MADDAKPWQADSAPKKTTAGGKTPARPKAPSKALPSVDSLREPLKDQFAMLGLAVYAKDQVDGTVILGASPQLVDAYCDLAKRNTRVHKILAGLAAGGDSLGVVTATAVMVLPILQHHGIWKGPLLVSLSQLEDRALNEHPDLGEEYDESNDSDLDNSTTT
jgi:hypothetical protein